MYTISESDLGPSEEVPPMSLADTLEAKAARTALEVGVGSTRQEILSAYRDESWYCHPGNPGVSDNGEFLAKTQALVFLLTSFKGTLTVQEACGVFIKVFLPSGAAYGLNFEAWDPRSILQKMRRCLNSVAVHIFKEDANHMLGRKKLKVDGGKSSEIGVRSLNLEDELDREEKKKAKKREKRKRAKAKKKQGSAETNGNSKGVTECVDSSGDSEEEAGRNSCGDGIDLDACFVQRALKGLRLSVNTDKVPLPQLREAQDVDEAAGVVRIGGKWAAAPSGHADDSISSNFPGFDDVSGIGAGYQVSSSCHVDMPDELRSRATVIGKEGFLLAKAGQHAAAVGKFTDALNLNPTDRRLWSNRAQCHFAMGNYLACIKDCEEACRLNPDWALGYLWSGRALWRLLQWKEAERAFGKCRMTAPEAFQAHEQELTSLREAYLVHHLGVPEEIAFSVSSRTATIAEAEAVVKGDRELGTTSSVSENFNPVASSVSNRKRADSGPPRQLIPSREQTIYVRCLPADTTEAEIREFFSSRVGPVSDVRLFSVHGTAFVNFCDDESAKIAIRHLNQRSFNGRGNVHILPYRPASSSLAVTGGVSGSTAIALSPDNTVFVRGVPVHIEADELKRLFSNCGTVMSTRVFPDYGTAFVNFSDKKAASTAMREMDGTAIEGSIIHVLPYKQKEVVECYFWRRGGCTNSACRFKHIPENFGADMK